jgi:hypothetical protein
MKIPQIRRDALAIKIYQGKFIKNYINELKVSLDLLASLEFKSLTGSD